MSSTRLVTMTVTTFLHQNWSNNWKTFMLIDFVRVDKQAKNGVENAAAHLLLAGYGKMENVDMEFCSISLATIKQ